MQYDSMMMYSLIKFKTLSSIARNQVVSKLVFIHGEPISLCFFEHGIQRIQKKFSRSAIHMNEGNTFFSEKVIKGFVKKSTPELQPFLTLMRITNSTGTWLLFWPCAWSVAFASHHGQFPNLYLLTLFALGSFIMRGAGCTINDMWDKDIDRKVSRTANRPLARASVTLLDSFIFLGLQLGVGCTILLQFNWPTVILGVFSLGPIIIYPLMKRITYWPQMILGLTFNWGAFLGWSAVHEVCDWSICLPLYCAGVSWTLIYDTIYAHQDKRDDLSIGIKSTAILFGQSTQKWLTLFSTLMVTNLVLAGAAGDQRWPYFLGVSGVFAHLFYQILTVKIDNIEDCSRKFHSNRHIGWILFLGITSSNLV